MDNLRIVTLPPDLPDSDPRWAGWLGQVNIGFLEARPSEETLRVFRDNCRADAIRLLAVHDPADALVHTPVATFSSGDKELNVGHGRLVPANLVSDVTVRATHRRRGLLRALMTHDLTAAKERGAVLSLLTASEGGIYGRFGFGLATRLARGEVTAATFALRARPGGSLAYVDAEAAGEAYDALEPVLRHRHRGAFERFRFHRLLATGEFSWDSGGENKQHRMVVHRDEAGAVDGLMAYEPVKDSDPTAVKCTAILAATGEASLALWGFLVNLDLVEKVEYRAFGLDDPLPAALVNSRAVKVTGTYDLLWLRVLDTERALRERGWDHDGELVLRVEDPLHLAEGTWRISVTDGHADVAASTDEPDATLDAETLGSLYLGGVAGTTLAAAGRISGDADAVARLFAVTTAPSTPVGF